MSSNALKIILQSLNSLSIETKTSFSNSPFIQFFDQNLNEVELILYAFQPRKELVIKADFVKLEELFYKINSQTERVVLFQKSHSAKQQLFDVSTAPKAMLIGFDAEGNRTSKQFLSGASSSSYIVSLQDEFVLFSPISSSNELYDFEQFFILDENLIISGNKKLKFVFQTAIFRADKLIQNLGALRMICNNFNLTILTDGQLVIFSSMGNVRENTDLFKAVEMAGLEERFDFVIENDECVVGYHHELEANLPRPHSTLREFNWLNSEVSALGNFVWLAE